MATKSKTGAYGKTDYRAGAPKTTSQGQGGRSRPERRGRKKLRGQGRG